MKKLSVLALLLTTVLALGAEEIAREPSAEAPAKATNQAADDDLALKDIFNSVLPGIVKKYSLRLIVRPRVSDLIKRDHMRMPIGLRYGLSSRWEAQTEVESFTSHGFGDLGWFEDMGFSRFRVSTKYNLGERFWQDWDTAVGIEHSFPVGRPPQELTDGLRHLAPFIALSHKLPDRPNWRLFWNFGADWVDRTKYAGTRTRDELGDDTLNVNTGVVVDKGPLHYTLELGYSTTRLMGDTDRHFFTVRPGVIWDIPSKYSYYARTQWTLGVAPKVSFGTEKTDFGVNVRLRANFDFKRWFGRAKNLQFKER